jgi:hypothetical protein
MSFAYRDCPSDLTNFERRSLVPKDARISNEYCMLLNLCIADTALNYSQML